MFDTHRIFEDLTAAGVPAAQATAHIAAFRLAVDDDRLATKADLQILKRDLIISVGGIVAAAVGLLAVLEKILT